MGEFVNVSSDCDIVTPHDGRYINRMRKGTGWFLSEDARCDKSMRDKGLRAIMYACEIHGTAGLGLNNALPAKPADPL